MADIDIGGVDEEVGKPRVIESTARNSATASLMSAQIRDTVDREIPDSLPKARTRSSTFLVETSVDPGLADDGVEGLIDPPTGIEQGREETPVP